jgi:hypothetical protein
MTERVAYMEEMRSAYKVLEDIFGKPRCRWEEWVLEKWGEKLWIEFMLLRMGTSGGLL